MKDLEDALGKLRATNVIFSPSSTTMADSKKVHGVNWNFTHYFLNLPCGDKIYKVLMEFD